MHTAVFYRTALALLEKEAASIPKIIKNEYRYIV